MPIRIDDYVADNTPISKYQWGFMHHRSSTPVLISVIHDWLCSLDSGVVFLMSRKPSILYHAHIPLLL